MSFLTAVGHHEEQSNAQIILHLWKCSTYVH